MYGETFYGRHLECQAKLNISVLNTSAHIKRPIMSRIVTKPTELQVLPAIAVELTDLSLRLTGPFVRLLGSDILVGFLSEYWPGERSCFFLYWSPRLYSIITLIVRKSSHSFKTINGNR